MSDWGYGNLEVLFSEGLPVRLIETPRKEFKTCWRSEQVGDVVARNSESFDFFPVTEGDSLSAQIVGLFDAARFSGGAASGRTISDVMQPITEKVLIGADAPIISFVREADQRSCRLVVSGLRISGIVTLFDLQRLPVRAALFAAVTQLEITMAEWIRSVFGGRDGWLEKLPAGRKANIEALIRAAQMEDTYVESLLLTQFADKRTIIQKCHDGIPSKNAFKSEMRSAEKLRNNLAHANDYAPTREAAETVCSTVRSIEKWIGLLATTNRRKADFGNN